MKRRSASVAAASNATQRKRTQKNVCALNPIHTEKKRERATEDIKTASTLARHLCLDAVGCADKLFLAAMKTGVIR